MQLNIYEIEMPVLKHVAIYTSLATYVSLSDHE